MAFNNNLIFGIEDFDTKDKISNQNQNIGNEQIELALNIALNAHKGQVDLDGYPAILHPLSVGIEGQNVLEKCVGFLHDVVEDSGYTFDDLLNLGVSPSVVDALRLLNYDKSVPYLDYIRNIEASGNITVLKVKMNDLRHNLRRGIAGGHTKQVKKHTEALEYLTRD
jgi:(p)ppGpp synthase/HD superfamily hydrolase